MPAPTVADSADPAWVTELAREPESELVAVTIGPAGGAGSGAVALRGVRGRRADEQREGHAAEHGAQGEKQGARGVSQVPAGASAPAPCGRSP